MADRIQIASDDPELVPLLRGLEDQVRDAGGYLNPQLRVVVSGGQIRVESEAPEGTQLLRIPEACLPVIDEVDFELSGDRLIVATYPEDMGASQRAVLDGMLAIYNRGQKLAAHRSESVWLALADQPALLAKLTEARRNTPKLAERCTSAVDGVDDRLLIEDYLGTRTLRYSFDQNRFGRVLMPFIDFFNHHSASPSFGRDGDGLTLKASRPLAGSAECFVRYNRLDALDALLSYGFADTSAPFLRSVPLRLELPSGGVVQVLGRLALVKKKIPAKELAFLRGWIPRFHRSPEGAIVAKELLIPRAARMNVLANVLAMMLAPLMPKGTGREAMEAAVQQALQTTIRVNHEYYRTLGELLETVGETPANRAVLEQVRRVVDYQLALLEDWREALATAAHSVMMPHSSETGPGFA